MKDWKDGGPIIDLYWVDRFETYLHDVIPRISPDVICEELSEAFVLSIPGGAVSVAYKVAKEQGIDHVFCDPNGEERDELYMTKGTTEDADRANGFPLREDVWLSRTEHLLPRKDVLFLCGADHVPTFRARLESKGFSVHVYCVDLAIEWGIEC